jgi:CBS domain-containing protein
MPDTLGSTLHPNPTGAAMSTISNFMTKEVFTLEPEMSLRDAVEALDDERVSGAPVLNGSRLVGVVSATDILEFQGANPAFEGPDDEPPPLRRTLGGEEEEEEDPSAYFVDLWGDGGADVYQRVTQSESPEWDFLERHTVGEVMTRKVVSIAPDGSLREAARAMMERGVHRLLVTENEALVGIITMTDLVRAIADGRLSAD